MKEEKKYKGIFSYECEDNSTGKFIYEIFTQKIGQKPIAQNILISTKETTFEQIQAFLYRAILCDYNTLFVFEINESLSDYKQGKIYNFLDELLIYKNEKFREKMKGINIPKKKTNKYLDACIILLYEKKNKDNLIIMNEINKLDKQNIQIENNLEESKDFGKSLILQNKETSNVTVITSDLCGLGKTFKIKKTIEKNNQKYFHLPLGGILTKKIISLKLNNLIKKIKEEIKEDNNNKNKKKINNSNEIIDIKYAIHLDLTESKETTVLNEFLFSLLITKFYFNNETIIYIPNDIDIYIEIPNCFKDYLSQFGILTLFPIENISLDYLPKLELPENIIEIFNSMVELNSNKSIEEHFIKNYMDNTKKYSYHQIIMFINLFISQYNKFKSKLHIIDTSEEGNEKDVTEEFINDFTEWAKCLINGAFQNLLMEINIEDRINKINKDYIDLLSEIYLKDYKGIHFDIPLIFIVNEKMIYEKLKIEKIKSKDYKNSGLFIISERIFGSS